jgi:kinetochore protein Mis13/DSN1
LPGSAAAVYDEQDGDFLFSRGAKRAKTDDAENEVVRPIAAKKAAGRPAKSKQRAASPLTATQSKTQPTARQLARRGSDAPKVEDQLVVPKGRGHRRKTRSSIEQADEAQDARNPRRAVTPTSAGDAVGDQGRKIALPFSDTPIINRNKEMRKAGAQNGRRSSLGMRGRRASSLIENGHSAIPHREVEPAEFYKHIEAEGLSEPRRMRQLLTWCGERALSEKPLHGSTDSNAVLGGMSCDIENWNAVSLTDGVTARAIQDQLLKDFTNKSEFSDWFSREDAPRSTVVLKPNPRNLEHQERIVELEAKIQR